MIGAGDIDERYADERDARRFACDGCGRTMRADGDWVIFNGEHYCEGCAEARNNEPPCPECGDGTDVCQCAEVLR